VGGDGGGGGGGGSGLGWGGVGLGFWWVGVGVGAGARVGTVVTAVTAVVVVVGAREFRSSLWRLAMPPQIGRNGGSVTDGLSLPGLGRPLLPGEVSVTAPPLELIIPCSSPAPLQGQRAEQLAAVIGAPVAPLVWHPMAPLLGAPVAVSSSLLAKSMRNCLALAKTTLGSRKRTW
jgi:hypothetical protein